MFSNYYNGKKVLVTGHTGFKGSWLSAWLLKLGADVVGYSKDIPTEESHFEVLGLSKNMKDIRSDIRDQKSFIDVLQEEKPEVVFHLAAEAIVKTCLDNPIESIETNALGSAKVLQSIYQSESVKSAVLITSDKCYENVEWDFGYRETDALGGKDPYSASKACAEIIFHSFFRTYIKDHSHLKVATARAGNVIGGGDWASYRIIPDCVRAVCNDSKVFLRNPASTRPWQHVLEPLSGYLSLGAELAKGESHNGESYNFGPKSEVEVPVKDLIDTMKLHWDKVSWETGNDFKEIAGKEAGLLKLCIDKSLRQLSWLPVLDFSETIEMTTCWYKDFYQNDVVRTNDNIKKYEELAIERGLLWAKN